MAMSDNESFLSFRLSIKKNSVNARRTVCIQLSSVKLCFVTQLHRPIERPKWTSPNKQNGNRENIFYNERKEGEATNLARLCSFPKPRLITETSLPAKDTPPPIPLLQSLIQAFNSCIRGLVCALYV